MISWYTGGHAHPFSMLAQIKHELAIHHQQAYLVNWNSSHWWFLVVAGMVLGEALPTCTLCRQKRILSMLTVSCPCHARGRREVRASVAVCTTLGR